MVHHYEHGSFKLENINVNENFFLLLAAWGELCSTVDGVAGKPAAADERPTVGRRFPPPRY